MKNSLKSHDHHSWRVTPHLSKEYDTYTRHKETSKNFRNTSQIQSQTITPKLLLLPLPVAALRELEGLICCVVELGELVMMQARAVVIPVMSTSEIRNQV